MCSRIFVIVIRRRLRKYATSRNVISNYMFSSNSVSSKSFTRSGKKRFRAINRRFLLFEADNHTINMSRGRSGRNHQQSVQIGGFVIIFVNSFINDNINNIIVYKVRVITRFHFTCIMRKKCNFSQLLYTYNANY